jgi:type IV secretion system protein VirD4
MSSTAHGGSCFDQDRGFDKKTALNGSNLLIGRSVSGLTYGYYASHISIDENHFAIAPPSKHLLSVAPTRSGKGVSLIIPNLLLYWGSAIVIDPKGENAWITAEYRRKMGQNTIILDPWDEVNRRYGDLAGEKEAVARFNPLSILNPESAHYAEDLASLADALIINQGKDPHWDDSARELVAGLMAYLVEMPEYRKAATLKMLRILLSKPVSEISGIAEDALKLGPDSVAARKLGRFAIDSRETASIISTALTQTAFLDSVTLAKNMEVSDFSFDDLITGQATIYLVLPVDKLQTYGRWLRLMLSIGIRTVARNVKPLPLPVLFMLDEFGTIGRLSAVSQAYGLMSGLQMMIWAFVQDLVQLKRDYPEEWETFVGNSYAISGFSIMDQFTANYFSNLLGYTTLEEISVLTAKKRESVFGDPNYSSMNDRTFGRALMQPSEIRGIRNDFGIFQGRGLPKIFQRVTYHEDPLFLKRSRPDPHFPEMKEKIAALKKADLLPDFKAAQALLEKKGYSLKKSWFSSKLTVTDKAGEEQTFASEAQLLEWARSCLEP